jgi:hypothetical protein
LRQGPFDGVELVFDGYGDKTGNLQLPVLERIHALVFVTPLLHDFVAVLSRAWISCRNSLNMAVIQRLTGQFG